MLIRLRLIGTGTARDPYGVDLPSWTCHSVDYVSGWMVVDVPSDDVPPFVDGIGTARFPIVPVDIQDTSKPVDPITGMHPFIRIDQPILVGLTVTQRVAWHLRLQRRWGMVRPDPAPDTV